jgi:RNA-binding protein
MLSSKQRSRLAALAQTLPDLVQLGKGGSSPALVSQLARLLATHELVKLRLLGHKDERDAIARSLAEDTASDLVRVIGNTAIFWKRNPDPEKRKIELD